MGSFKNRLLILIVALMALAQGLTVLLSLADLSTRVRNESERQLRSSRVLLEQLLSNRAAQLDASSRVLVSDFAFRSAVASNDHDTIVSALSNHAGRINADLAVLFDAEGKAIASTENHIPGNAISLPESFDNSSAQIYAPVGKHLYELVFAPVRAPDVIGWVALGFSVDDKFVQQLRNQTDTDIAFMVSGRDGQPLVVSTLGGLSDLGIAPGTDTSHEITLKNSVYLALSSPLSVQEGSANLAVLRSLDEATRQFRQMRFALLSISGLALLGAMVVAWLAGRNAVKPLGQLVDAAQRVQQGNYNTSVDAVSYCSEFQQLAQTFNDMQQGIRDREARIYEQSRQDHLTGLLNRDALCELMTTHIDDTQIFSVAKLDVQRFRDINASLGHGVGDQVLSQIARYLQQYCFGAHVARVGADRFAVVLPLHDTQMMHRMLSLGGELQRGITVGEQRITLEIRVGISEWRWPRVSADDWLRQADVALLESKERGPSVVLYQSSHDAEHHRRIMLVAELRRAIVEGGLSLMYQPLAQMTNRDPASFEVLVRWTHPTLGAISPGEFIPLAERASFIGDITRWVLTSAIVQLGAWRRQGFNTVLAINLSADDVTDASLFQLLVALLNEHQVPATQLILEVTESAIMHDPQLAVQAMQQLRTLGIRFAIDDFGTGHSSLAQLHALPVDELKIDRAFVRNIDTSRNNAAIVRATTELAHSLGLFVVAEGVETPEEWNALLMLGCDLVQGYYVSRPMPANLVVDWTLKQRQQLQLSVQTATQDGQLMDLRTRLPS